MERCHTQVKRLAFVAYITAACGTSTLLSGPLGGLAVNLDCDRKPFSSGELATFLDSLLKCS